MAHMGMYLERAESPNRWDDPFKDSGTLAGNTTGGNALTEDDMAKTAYDGSAAFHPDHVPKNDTSDGDIGSSTKETIENFSTNPAKSSLREGRTGTPCFHSHAFAKSASLNISSLDANKTKDDIKFINEKCLVSFENGISENHDVDLEAKSYVSSRCVQMNEVGSSMVSHRSDSFALDHIKDERIESCGHEHFSPSSGTVSSAIRLDGHHRSKNTYFLRRNKSVKFAAISRWKKYDADCIISESLDKNESNAIIHSTLRQWRKRRLPKTNKLPSRMIEFVSSRTIQQTEALVENARPQLTAEESARTSSIHINNSSDLSLHSHQSFSVTVNPAIVVKPESSESDQHGLLAHTKLHRNENKKNVQIALLHSPSHTQIIYHAMKYIHKDRDLLLESLLKWCGILQGAKGSLSSFFSILPPKRGTRKLLQCFHAACYLDLLEYPPTEQNGFGIDGFLHDHNAINNPEIQALLAKHGLEDDCSLPADSNARKILWKYCLSVAGASWHAASLLMGGSPDEDERDVVIHWGGGRHHSHSDKAGGFCYVNDVVLAIHRLLHSRVDGVDDGMFAGILDNQSSSSFGDKSTPRILYIDLDIHHPDGVQSAFYSTDRVFTASFHRFAPGFFPALSGSIREKGESGSAGLGYNLNVPLPAGIGDVAFIRMFRRLLFGLVKSYDPHAVVLCLGADGLKGDELITGSGRGCDNLGKFVNFECTSASSGECWNLSPEGLAECVRIAAALCAGVEGEEILSAPPKDVIDKVSFQDAEPDVMVDQLSSEKKQRSPAYKTNRKKRKLLILGGGGYTPAQTARTYLLCTAAACEGARPGMMWSELPKDIPAHDYFPMYGPSFELVSEDKKLEIFQSYYVNDSIVGEASDHQLLREGMRAIDLACLYIDHDRGKKFNQRTGLANGQVDSFSFDGTNQDEVILTEISRKRKKEGTKKSLGGRRRKKKIPGKSIP